VAIKALLFDFDGTIADSSTGIIASLKYALEINGVGANITEEKIKISIGPPLLPLIERVLDGKANERMMKAIAVSYREHYSEKGLFMAELYEDVGKALNSLSTKYLLFVVSSKPKEFLEKLILKLDIIKYFKGIYGPGLGLTPLKKAQLVKVCMEENNLNPDECIMIGDKAEDVEAAKTNEIKTVGALYGFGTAKELEIAGAACLIEKPYDLMKMDYNSI
jgi:phosphoglycolate phosphatase